MGISYKFGKFEWDLDKASENLKKHQLDFFFAVEAFLDIPVELLPSMKPGERESLFMKKKTNKRVKDSNEPQGKLLKIADFLPPPSELLPKNIKITLTLDKRTVDFFKAQARNNNEKYQRMMREVLRGYANKHNT